MNLILSEKLVFYIVIIFICETTMHVDIAVILFFLFCLVHKGKAVANAFKWANKSVFSYIHFTVICISMLELNSGPHASYTSALPLSSIPSLYEKYSITVPSVLKHAF